MISYEEVEKLAKLARLEMTEGEKKGLQKEMESILGMVDELKNAPDGETEEKLVLKNVMREDDGADEPEQFTEELLSASPRRQENYFKVKKILG